MTLRPCDNGSGVKGGERGGKENGPIVGAVADRWLFRGCYFAGFFFFAHRTIAALRACADVRAFALPVLRHRVFVSFAAAAEGVDADAVVAHLLKTVEEPRA